MLEKQIKITVHKISYDNKGKLEGWLTTTAGVFANMQADIANTTRII